MRPVMFAVPLLLAIPFLLPASEADAQARGTYRRTCTDIDQNGSVLSARCRTAGGDYIDTTLDVSQCGNIDIVNSNGRLLCGNARGSGRSGRGDDLGGRRRRGYDAGGYDAGRPPADPDAGSDDFRPRRPRYAPPPDDSFAPPRRRYDPDADN